MDKILDKTAEELFGKIRSQFSKIQLGDQDSTIIDEPKDARFFEFDFEREGVSLGSVTITLDTEDGLTIMYSNDMVHDQPTSVKKYWFNFLKELREFAKRRLMNFEARDILKTLDKRDYQYLSKNKGDKQVTESKLWGTSRTSFQQLGNSRLVIKHSEPVNEENFTGRSKKIHAIYIENNQGERFKYPSKHLNGARALARHVSNGGTPYDSLGTHIIGLSEELKQLRNFKGYVSRNEVVSESMGAMQVRVMERIDDIKRQLNKLQGQHNYQVFAESFSESEFKEIPEEVMTDWVDRLTIRMFNEDLKTVFPYLYRIMGEEDVKNLTPNDFESYTTISEDVDTDEHDDLVEYEQYLDSLIEDNNLYNSPESQKDAIIKLKELFEIEMPVGADGTNAITSLSGIIDDQELNDVLKELSDIDPDMDARPLIKDYIKIKDQDNGTNILSQLETAKEQATENVKHVSEKIHNVIKAGMKLEDTFNISGKNVTLRDAIEMAGLKVEDYFQNDSNSDTSEIVEFVKSMYDANTGNFPKGETGVVLSVEKQFGKPATKVAVQTIKELRNVYENTRMRKLAGI